MRLRTLALLGATALAFGTAANAAHTVSSTGYGLAAPAGAGTLVTFDGALPAGYTLTGSGYVVQSGTNANGAAPADGPTDATDDTTQYLSVTGIPVGSPGAKLLGPTAYSLVSLYWGSIDSYNTLTLLDAAGNVFDTITSVDIAAGNNGDQLSSNTNRRVNITSTTPFYGLGFQSTQQAFEVDNVKFLSAVPEPATWALMLLGFGGMGFALRRGRKQDLMQLA